MHKYKCSQRNRPLVVATAKKHKSSFIMPPLFRDQGAFSGGEHRSDTEGLI